MITFNLNNSNTTLKKIVSGKTFKSPNDIIDTLEDYMLGNIMEKGKKTDNSFDISILEKKYLGK